MPSALWLILASAALGAGAAVHGMITLGLADRDGSDKGVARRRREGLFGLYFGAGVVLLSLASWLNAQDSEPLALLALTAAMCLSGVAVFRYRSRPNAE